MIYMIHTYIYIYMMYICIFIFIYNIYIYIYMIPRCVNILVNVLNIFAFQSVASSDGQKLTHLEVMYLTTSAGSSACGAGKWLVQRASDDDYVDAQLGYFELKGQSNA